MVARSRAYAKDKRYKRSANAKDYAKMLVVASEVVVHCRGYITGVPNYVLMTFPHWVKFDKSFPKGHIVEKDAETNTYKVNAVKLLDWLYNNGHSSYDAKKLVAMSKEFEMVDKAVDRLFKI